MPVKFLVSGRVVFVGGGSADLIFMGAGIFLSFAGSRVATAMAENCAILVHSNDYCVPITVLHPWRSLAAQALALSSELAT